MENYKKASQLGLRFITNVGPLSVEQLWQLSQKQLVATIKAVSKLLKSNSINDDELSFLDESKEVDVENQLRFEILKDVYLTKQNEINDQRKKADDKAHNAKIDALIADKEELDMKNLSVEELKNLRRS